MALPIDLVLVRHGESEGNAAKRLSEQGSHGAIETLRERHTSRYRLTKKGRGQALKAGEWIRKNFFTGEQYGFDRCYVSEYIRAMETAALLQLPCVKWFCDFYLCERDWGELHALPEEERWEKFGDALRMKRQEPFFWIPPNGESFAKLCHRVDRVLDTLHRECSDKKVIIVCHGEVMWAFRVRLERMSQQRFRELNLSEQKKDKIYNCQIFHYTRRNPHTNKLMPHAHWMRSVRPTKSPLWDTEWQEISRPRYTNEDLLEIVHSVSPTVQ
ncbi:MAG: histidine phosphatase family protein [Parcubacteria group bacterium]|nr:histidine phosphatase family protein [Parcubacteria group bacterium]